MIGAGIARGTISLALMLVAGVACAAGGDVDGGGSERARLNYLLHCQGCHRPDGLGNSRSTPPLIGELGQFLSTRAGREYLARVPGVAMAPLSDSELADLLNWTIFTFDRANVPQGFEPYSPTEIGVLRQKPLGSQTSTIRAGLLSHHDPLVE
jgi:cytochrome c553